MLDDDFRIVHADLCLGFHQAGFPPPPCSFFKGGYGLLSVNSELGDFSDPCIRTFAFALHC